MLLQGLVGPLEVITDRLSKAWGTVSHLKVGTSLFAVYPSCGAPAGVCVVSVQPFWFSLCCSNGCVTAYLRWYVSQAVKDSKELREAVEEVQPEQVKLGLRLSQV